MVTQTIKLNKKPLVSVVLCSFNAERFIESTINSIINQTYKNMEVLILDNNSKDNTLKIIKKYLKIDKRIKLFKNKKNVGPYFGLNFLISRACGKYIAIIDHDDIWHPKKIELQINFLEKNKKYIGVGGLPLRYYENKDIFQLIKVNKIGYFSPHPSLVFHNNGFFYDTSIKYKTDIYFMRFTLCKNKKLLYNLQKPLYLSRVRNDGMNLNSKWLNINNLFSYYYKSKNKKHLLNGLVKIILPKRILKILEFQFYGNDLKTEKDLMQDDSLRPLIKMIKEELK